MDLQPRKIWADEQADLAAVGMVSAGMDIPFAMTDNKSLEQQVAGLFETLRIPVYQYLVAAFGDSAEAEDVTQDAFLQLYKALREGQTIRNVRYWVFRVAHNLAINRRKHDQFIAPLSSDSWDEIERRLPETGLNPEQIVLHREKFERLFNGIKRLSIQERQALYLRAEGFRYKEIAEIMNIATPTVGEYLQRAIKKLTGQNGD
jgi:RNA polymerase sigma-70 factor (ECF subfamily)